MDKTKTVYLHENGKLVIWGMSEFFEPSHFVVRQFKIDMNVADSEDFRKIVQLYNIDVEQLKKDTEIISSLENARIILNENIQILKDRLERIEKLSFWKRLFKSEINNIANGLK